MENLKNSICLFDVDGTLTESRQSIKKQMLNTLRELSYKTEIGILTGSGLEYIKEQLWPLLADQELSMNCHLLPCNGVEYYIPNPESPGNFIEIHRNNMETKLGFEKFQFLIKTLIKLQAQLVEQEYDISFSGHHIQNRYSTLNWCPIGRNAENGERQQFKAMDKIYGIRSTFIHKFKQIMLQNQIHDAKIKLAGDTSFDIYPIGWDKTYALNHFPSTDWDVFFVGDRCYPDGNDYEIYEFLKPLGRSFETKDPEDTIEIIDIELYRLLGALDDNS